MHSDDGKLTKDDQDVIRSMMLMDHCMRPCVV